MMHKRTREKGERGEGKQDYSHDLSGAIFKIQVKFVLYEIPDMHSHFFKLFLQVTNHDMQI